MEKSIKTQKLRTTKGNNNKDANKCFKKTKQDVFQMKISSRNCIVLNVFRQKKKNRKKKMLLRDSNPLPSKTWKKRKRLNNH
jgi:hypothetical protein